MTLTIPPPGGGGPGCILTAKHPSGCLMTAKFAWHITAVSGKWAGPYQVYKFNRPYIPVDANDLYDTGESVVITKTKVRGKGEALMLRFESEPDKDFQLLGYSIPYEVPMKI